MYIIPHDAADVAAIREAEMNDAIAWERMKYEDKLEQVREDADRRIEETLRSIRPLAEGLLVGTGVFLVLAALGLYNHDIQSALCSLAGAVSTFWVSRAVRQRWSWEEEGEDDPDG